MLAVGVPSSILQFTLHYTQFNPFFFNLQYSLTFIRNYSSTYISQNPRHGICDKKPNPIQFYFKMAGHSVVFNQQCLVWKYKLLQQTDYSVKNKTLFLFCCFFHCDVYKRHIFRISINNLRTSHLAFWRGVRSLWITNSQNELWMLSLMTQAVTWLLSWINILPITCNNLLKQ